MPGTPVKRLRREGRHAEAEALLAARQCPSPPDPPPTPQPEPQPDPEPQVIPLPARRWQPAPASHGTYEPLECVRELLALARFVGIPWQVAWPTARDTALHTAEEREWADVLIATQDAWRAAYHGEESPALRAAAALTPVLEA